METLYRVELRRQAAAAATVTTTDPSDGGGEPGASADWLCAWLGSQHLCLNVSRKSGDGGGEVHAMFFRSTGLLNATGDPQPPAPRPPPPSPLTTSVCPAGVPPDAGGTLRWTRDAARLWLLAEVTAGDQHLRAEAEGGRAGQGRPRWDCSLGLSHHAVALETRGLPGSAHATAYYQVPGDGGGDGDGMGVEVPVFLFLLSPPAGPGGSGSGVVAPPGGQESGGRPLVGGDQKRHGGAGSVATATAGAAPGGPPHVRTGRYALPEVSTGYDSPTH